MVVAPDRAPARAWRRRSRARPSRCPVGQRAARLARGLQLEQQLEAEPRRRVGAGAEGLAGIDDDVDRALARRLPGGAQPEPAADQQRLVEVAPAVGPVVGDLGGADLDPAARRPRRRARPAPAAPPRRRRSRTRRSRGRAPPRPRSAPARSARPGPAPPARARSGPRGGSTRTARRTRPKRPSPCARARGSPSSSVSSRRSASSRCSSLRLAGTMTLRITRWLPRRRLPSRGRPAPRRTSSVPGWVPGCDLDLRARRRASARVTVGAEHRLGRGDRDDADQVAALALEALVLGDPRPRRRGRRPAPPGSPAWPAPVIRIRWPSSIPAGTSTS